MEYRFTRQELYDRVWSTPMTRLILELGTNPSLLNSLLRRADIPKPRPGYWIKKQFEKPVIKPPLPPPPPGCAEIIVLDTQARTTRVQPSISPMPKPALETLAAPSTATSAPPIPAEPAPQPRPTRPTFLTREELYAAVWKTPLSRLAEGYGISGSGLAKICERADIPYPPRGYWAMRTVGKAPERPALPASAKAPRQIIIRPTLPPEPPIEQPEGVRRLLDDARSKASSMAVVERLVRPHSIIAAWLADHEERKRRARLERDPSRKKLYGPGDLSDSDRRQHRLLDALFKAIERQGGKVKQDGQLFVEIADERVEFQLHEKRKRVRRPLTPDEKRWRVAGDKDWKQELVPTGRLIFDIKTFLPARLKRQWVESDAVPLEGSLPDIVATFVAAGPLLVQRRRDREIAERERQLAERRRYEERQRRKRDSNQWRYFREMAQDWHQLALVRDFLTALRSYEIDPEIQVDGRNLRDWLTWAETRLQRAAPTADGIVGVFKALGAIREWSYRD